MGTLLVNFTEDFRIRDDQIKVFVPKTVGCSYLPLPLLDESGNFVEEENRILGPDFPSYVYAEWLEAEEELDGYPGGSCVLDV